MGCFIKLCTIINLAEGNQSEQVHKSNLTVREKLWNTEILIWIHQRHLILYIHSTAWQIELLWIKGELNIDLCPPPVSQKQYLMYDGVNSYVLCVFHDMLPGSTCHHLLLHGVTVACHYLLQDQQVWLIWHVVDLRPPVLLVSSQ